MEQRDLLKTEIEQLGRSIGKVLADLIELNNNNCAQITINTINKYMNSQLDFDVDKLISDRHEIKFLADEHYDSIANFLFQMGISHDGLDNKSYLLLVRAKDLFYLIESKSKTASFERLNKIKQINDLID